MNKKILILSIGMVLLIGVVFAVTVISTTDSLSKGLIGHWSLDGDDYDSATNRVGDSTPYENHGANSGATLTTDRMGKSEGAMSFDGSGTVDGVTYGDNIIMPESITSTNNYPDGCTYSVWIYVDTDAVDRMALFRGSGTIRHIEIFSSGKYFRTEAARQNGYNFGTGAFPDDVRGAWSHFVIVFANNETNRPVRWYQNGEMFYTGSMDGGTYPGTEYFSFGSIGRSTGSTSYHYAKSFDGSMDDVRIYNRALSEKEIGKLYDSYNPKLAMKSSKGLVGHWPLDGDTYDEYTENLAVGTLSPYTPYNTLERDGQDLTFTMVEGGAQYLTVHNGVNYNGNIITLSGYLFKNGDPHTLPGNRANTYHSSAASTWSFDEDTGYFEIVENCDASSIWLFHTPAGTVGGDIITINDFQVELKDHATSFINGTRQSKVTDSTPFENHGVTNSGLDTPSSTTDRHGKSEGAMSFDGVDDYVEIVDDDSLDISGNVTISSWVYLDGISGGWPGIVRKQSGTSSPAYGLELHPTSGFFAYFTDDESNIKYLGWGSLPELNEWYHVVAKYDGSKVYICVNNVCKDTDWSNSGSLQVNSESLFIGKRSSSILNGSISDVRIYNYALSPTEIKSLYDAYEHKVAASSLTKGLVLDMPLTSTYKKSNTVGSEIMTDKTPYSNHGQNYGATVGEDSMSFDGSDYVAGFNGFLVGLTELSISAWVNPSSSTYIFQHGSSNSHNGYMNYFRVDADGSLTIDVQHVAAAHFTPSSDNGEVEMNEWSHVGAIIDSDSINFYVNGELIDSNSFSGMYPLATSAANYRNIGRYYYRSDSISYSTGNISSVKIYNRALSDTEIKLLYDKGR